MKTTLSILLLSLAWISCNDNRDSNVAYGHFEADERILSSETLGKVVTLMVDEGQKLNAGDPVALIDTSQLQLTLKQLEATMEAVKLKTKSLVPEIDVLEQRKSYLEGEVKRFTKLVADSAATPKQLNDLKAEVEVIKKQIRAVFANQSSANQAILSELKPLDAKLDAIRNQLEKSTIRAPFDGTVISIITYEGEFAIPGKPIIKMARLDEMNIRVYLTGEQLSQVKLGEDLVVVATVSEDTLSGKVNWISDKAEFTPKNIQTADEKASLVYAVKIGVNNNGKLKRGMPGEVRLNNEQ